MAPTQRTWAGFAIEVSHVSFGLNLKEEVSWTGIEPKFRVYLEEGKVGEVRWKVDSVSWKERTYGWRINRPTSINKERLFRNRSMEWHDMLYDSRELKRHSRGNDLQLSRG